MLSSFTMKSAKTAYLADDLLPLAERLCTLQPTCLPVAPTSVWRPISALVTLYMLATVKTAGIPFKYTYNIIYIVYVVCLPLLLTPRNNPPHTYWHLIQFRWRKKIYFNRAHSNVNNGFYLKISLNDLLKIVPMF